jgi:hypothetical protein
MRFIIANEFYEQMLQYPHHTADCFVRPGEYLHHLYIDGVKYAVAPAVDPDGASIPAFFSPLPDPELSGCTFFELSR